MRDAENESHEGKRKAESLWPIMRISHARSRYVYELYYKREAISRELYDWLLKEGYADAKYVYQNSCSHSCPRLIVYFNFNSLLAKWKKTGYEKLCCLRCIQTRVWWSGYMIFTLKLTFLNQKDMNYQGSTCICRVPKAQVRSGTVVECVHCGTFARNVL